MAAFVVGDCLACLSPVALCTGTAACSQAQELWGSALRAEVGRKHKTLRADVISEKCPFPRESGAHCLSWRGLVSLAWPAALGLSVDPVSTSDPPSPMGSPPGSGWKAGGLTAGCSSTTSLPPPLNLGSTWVLPEAWSNQGWTLPLGGVSEVSGVRPG